MGIIGDEDTAQLKDIFAQQLTSDVTLVHYTQRESRIIVPGVVPCATCKANLELLQELVALSDHLYLEVFDFVAQAEVAAEHGIEKIPATVVRGTDGGERARFFGVPAGYEFTTLLEDILEVGGAGSQLAPEAAAALEGLANDVHIQVFVTPTCPYCPRAVLTAFRLAMESKLVSAAMVEATEFPHLANRHQVSGVPHTVIGDSPQPMIGAYPEGAAVDMILATLQGKKVL